MSIAELVPGKTDHQMAEQLREELGPHLKDLCVIVDRAKSMGLTVNFNISPDPYGRSVSMIHIVKAL